MKKIFLLALFTFLLTESYSQGFTSSKVVNTEMTVSNYEKKYTGKTIHYVEINNGYTIRVAGHTLQFFDANFDLVWEKAFDIIYGRFRYNDFNFAWDDEFIYVMQENSTSYEGVGKEEAILRKFNYQGEQLQQITFSDLEEIQYTRKMKVIDGDLFIHWVKQPLASFIDRKKTGYYQDFFCYVSKLDGNLKLDGTYLLPPTIDGTEINVKWNFLGH